jgi:flagellar basal-body rod protein FlgB
MPISSIPIFSMLRTRMQWHQERQRLLAENVANADTPGFQPRDLAPPKFDQQAPLAAGVTLVRTSAAHLAGLGNAAAALFKSEPETNPQIQPGGNGVSLEDEMMKVAANQMDYQAAAAIYERSLGLIKIALDNGG